MVTRKAVVRPGFWRAPHFQRRSKTSATNCARRCSALRMKEVRCGRACRGLHHRVTKTRAKSAGRTKMTRSLSNTIDVRRRNFGVRNGGIERSGAANVVRIVLSDSRQRARAILDSVWSREMCDSILALEKLRCRSPSGCGRRDAPALPKAKSAHSGTERHQISPNNGCCWATIVA